MASWENGSKQYSMNLFCHSILQKFLKRVMSDAMKEHARKVRISGGNFTNLRFADYIDDLPEEKREQ